MIGAPDEDTGEAVHAFVVPAAGRALAGAFRSRGLAVEERSGRGTRGYGSDDASFTRLGIPAVGLHTGAGERKTDGAAVRRAARG